MSDHAVPVPVFLMVALALGAGGCSLIGTTLGRGNSERTTSATGEPLVRLQHDRPEGIDLTHYHDAPMDKVIPLEVEFATRNKAQFDELTRKIADPHSPQYRHWLTPEEMHTRFGETRSQFDGVKRWLQEQGFTITDESYGTNADYIRFKGSIGQIEKAFDVQLAAPNMTTMQPETTPRSQPSSME